MRYWINRIWVWLRRWKHSRGFGVQSPWAYQFIRYVVNEHYPYYCYEDMKRKHPELTSRERKMCRLYFRLANYRQATTILEYGGEEPLSGAVREYIAHGCKRSEVVRIADAGAMPERVEMLRIVPRGDYRSVIEKAIERADERSMIVLEDIYRSREARLLWDELTNDSRCITTFDLYECGILFFDSKRYKENYIVNF